jgi:hypothetical protein
MRYVYVVLQEGRCGIYFIDVFSSRKKALEFIEYAHKTYWNAGETGVYYHCVKKEV